MPSVFHPGFKQKGTLINIEACKFILKINTGAFASTWRLCGPSDKDIPNSTLNAATLAQPLMRF